MFVASKQHCQYAMYAYRAAVGAAAYLSDAAFEYAFGGEDLVSDLLQFHVDVARRPYSTPTAT